MKCKKKYIRSLQRCAEIHIYGRYCSINERSSQCAGFILGDFHVTTTIKTSLRGNETQIYHTHSLKIL
ncbi:hypothetical protein M153_9000011908 [Pseudoloma neurophilia]|uniref:Uncharacterized protein n=1 Tax=Pseudoloma neurophilia TaxID=146866 RepID=A0A0R0M5S4_9MICR|nr:hypothetical protein M153_9000011908 [Pseudoloma neurophilia]